MPREIVDGEYRKLQTWASEEEYRELVKENRRVQGELMASHGVAYGSTAFLLLCVAEGFGAFGWPFPDEHERVLYAERLRWEALGYSGEECVRLAHWIWGPQE